MFSILKHYFVTKYFRNFKKRENLEIWQHRQVVQHLKKILPLSTFYNQLYQGLNLQNWKEFPIIDKHMMMVHFDLLNTVNIKKNVAFSLAMESERVRHFFPKIGNITVGLSSGTSGNRGIFLVSPGEQLEWAGTLLAKALPRSIVRQERIALFMRANSNLYETTRTHHIDFQFYDLFLPFEEHLDKLNRNPPSVLAGPPSVLRLLCQQISKGDLHIKPKRVISLAEVLDPLDEAIIQQTFEQKVHQIYQCTEGFLGITCPYGTLHLNEDIAVIQKEFIDKDAGKFVPIITDFRRISQPILRYRLNDILTERKTACPCGSCFTALEKIEGRCDDIFYLPSLNCSSKLIPIFPDYIRNAVTDSSNEIEEFMVVQRDTDHIEIAIKPRGSTPLELMVRSSIQKLCLRLMCCVPNLEFVPYLENKKDKKLRRIRSEYVPSKAV